MKRRSLLVAAALATAGCPQIAPEQDAAPPPDSDDWQVHDDVEGSISGSAHQNLVVRDHDFATADDHARVRGTVRNTRDSEFPGVGIEVTLFSGEGDEIRSESAESDEGLDPEEEWEFAVLFEDVDPGSVASYEMETGGDPSP